MTSSYWLKKKYLYFSSIGKKTQSFSFLLFLNICLICKHTASTITFSKTIHCISCKKKSSKKLKSVCFFWFCVKYFIFCLPQLYGWFLQKFLASYVAKFVSSLSPRWTSYVIMESSQVSKHEFIRSWRIHLKLAYDLVSQIAHATEHEFLLQEKTFLTWCYLYKSKFKTQHYDEICWQKIWP